MYYYGWLKINIVFKMFKKLGAPFFLICLWSSMFMLSLLLGLPITLTCCPLAASLTIKCDALELDSKS